MLTALLYETLEPFSYAFFCLNEKYRTYQAQQGSSAVNRRFFSEPSRISNIKSTLFESLKESLISQDRLVLSQGVNTPV